FLDLGACKKHASAIEAGGLGLQIAISRLVRPDSQFAFIGLQQLPQNGEYGVMAFNPSRRYYGVLDRHIAPGAGPAEDRFRIKKHEHTYRTLVEREIVFKRPAAQWFRGAYVPGCGPRQAVRSQTRPVSSRVPH